MSTVIHLMNPAAGKGLLPDISTLEGEVYVTEHPGDAVEYLKRRLVGDEKYTIYVYGGDGTLHEAANGVMLAGHEAKVTLVPVPTGSGNDFYRVTGDFEHKVPCDIISYNGRYAINEVNVGFDCDVANRTNELKKSRFIGGSFSYILGLIVEFAKKHPIELSITVTSADGTVETFADKFMMCAVANGRYYGGGFMAAPIAEVSDGLLDVIIVKDLSRTRFLKLVGPYKNGLHINRETSEIDPKLADVLIFRRATKVLFEGAYLYSADGEIHENEDGKLVIECIPSAIKVRSDAKKSVKQPAPAL